MSKETGDTVYVQYYSRLPLDGTDSIISLPVCLTPHHENDLPT